MSNETNIFLSTFLRSIRDACLRQVAFNSRVTTSGFLCVSVDGNRQSQFVIDEIFRKPGQEGTSHSYALKNLDLKPTRSHYTQRPLHRDPRSRVQGSLIPAPGGLRTAGRRRNKPHTTPRQQGGAYVTSQARAASTPRPCHSQTGGRASPRSTNMAEPSLIQANYTPTRNPHKSLHNLNQQTCALQNGPRSPSAQPMARSNWSNLSRGTFSSRSLAPQLRTGTRHFFRSSSRNEKNNTTFTLDNVMRSHGIADKGNTTQNKACQETQAPLSQNFDKSCGLMYPLKNMQNRAAPLVERTIKVSQTNPVDSFEKSDTREHFKGTNQLAGAKGEQKPNGCHDFPREISHKMSFDSVHRTDVREGIKGSTHTLSYPMQNNFGKCNSYNSCLSVADIDTSCEFDLPRMSDLDDTDYLSEQDISITATEPPCGFVESQIDPYQYFMNEQNVPNHMDQSKHQFSFFQGAAHELSPISSEPVINSASKAPPREVYSDGNILDNHHNGGAAKSQEISNHGKSSGSINNFSNRIKHEINSHFNNSDNQSHANYRDISELVDDVMSMMTQSQHKDYGEELRRGEWTAKNSPRIWKSNAEHADLESMFMDDCRVARQEETSNSFRPLTHPGDKMVVPLRPMSPQDQHAPLVTSVRPQPRVWTCATNKGNCSDAKYKMRPLAASDCRSSSHNYTGSSNIHASKYVRQVTPRGVPLTVGKPHHSHRVIGVRPSPTFHLARNQDAAGVQGSAVSQASVKGQRSTLSQRSAVSQVSVKGQRSAASQRSTMSQRSAGDWSVDAEVTESPSIIKKKSKLRKWMRLFKKDTSPLPLRDAQHTLPSLAPAGSSTTVNWALRHRHRCPDYKKKFNDGEHGRFRPSQTKGVRL